MNQYPSLKYLSFLFLVVTIGYLFTLNPALFRNDSPETIVGCMTLGVTHPPGYPLFNLIGKLLYLPVGNPAFSYNFLAALLGASGACLLYVNAWLLIGRIQLKKTSSQGLYQNIAAFVAGLCLAFSQGYWGNSIAAKGGVYILQVVIELGLFLAWQLSSENFHQKFKLLTLFFFLIGLTNHWPTDLLLTPAFLGTLVLNRNKIAIPNLNKAVLASTLGFVALSLYLYLPLRANRYPPINFDIPINFKNFITSVSRYEYTQIEFTGNNPEVLLATLGPKSAYIGAHFLVEFQLLAYLLIAIGTIAVWRNCSKTALFLGLVFMATTVSNALYLNVEPIEYWHLDDHLLSTNWILALLIGIGGFQFLKTTANYRSIYFYFALTFILAIAPLTYLHHFKTNDQKNSFLYYGYGISTLQIMPKGTLFFAESDYDYFSLLYLKTILNKRPDTHLVLMPFLSKTGEAEALKRCDPDISRDLGKLLFKNLIIRNQSLRPIMTMFPNGSFSKEYLRNFDRLSIDPMGLAVVVSPSRTNPNNSINYSSLINFWGHYADPSLRTTYAEEGLLRHACSLAYSNEAYFEGLNTQFKNKNEKINRSNRIKTYTIMAKRLN